MPSKCCTSDPIPLRAVAKLFPNRWKKKWNRKYEENTTKNRVYCPANKCGEWVRPEDIKMVKGKKYGICRKCKTKVCGTCNAKWHGARDCPTDAETNALLETAREAGWQRCYSCRTLVELKEGCNHMTCRCKAEFCMLCAAKWRTCTCPWFNYAYAVEVDRLANMPVPGDIPGARHPFPGNAPNPPAAFFPPPRHARQDRTNVAVPPPVIDAFDIDDEYGENLHHQEQIYERRHPYPQPYVVAGRRQRQSRRVDMWT